MTVISIHITVSPDGAIRGALQKTASRLVGQTTQERADDSELYEGVRALDAAQQEMRREWAAEEAARTPPLRRPRKPKG